MNAKSQSTVWVVFLVAHDNTGSGADSEVEPYVGYEPVTCGDDPHEMREASELTALLRGGYVVGVMQDADETAVQAAVAAAEKSLLRMR